MRPILRAALVLVLPALLAGCDLLGIEGASAVAARREAEGKAIGGACRHAARSIEACYAANKKADKAAVFAGWREMNDYMRENKIESMPGSDASTAAAAAAAEGDEAGEDEARAGAAAASAGAGQTPAGRKPAAKPTAAAPAISAKPVAAKPH